MTGKGRLPELRLSPKLLVAATAVLVLADWGQTMAGASFVPGGPLDETAHVLTMLIVLWALGDRVRERLGIAALVASVAIDVDHVPQYLGFDFLTRGTPRPYSHSLLTIAVVLLLAAVWRRRRDCLMGVALGLVVHFWRDLSEAGSGVALLWPFSDHSFSLPRTSYVLIMSAVVAVDAWKCRSGRPTSSGRWSGAWPVSGGDGNVFGG
jgi:inner membrane protein